MTGAAPGGPEVTLIIPCYNERDGLERTVPPLFAAFSRHHPQCEMILVDNGSTDGTGEIIDRIVKTDPRYRKERVPENRGYGLGVLTGYRAAKGRCIGHIPADGPVTPDDVAMIARRSLDEGPGTLVTAVRLSRADTTVRKIVSRLYNSMFLVLFGRYTPDINGTPKFLHAADLPRFALRSEDYFLEAEMMIKARRLGFRTVPVPILSQFREAGRSKVSARLVRTCAEFVRNLLRARFGTLT